jgi:hypothetical protein
MMKKERSHASHWHGQKALNEKDEKGKTRMGKLWAITNGK